MGLDMYAYTTRKPILQVGFEQPDDAVQIFYWRKHPNLHGWMENLYQRKGGTELFNCEAVKIEAEDLDALEAAVKDDRLPETSGFFFGVSRPEEKADDLAFIAQARAAIKNGYNVFYTSWW